MYLILCQALRYDPLFLTAISTRSTLGLFSLLRCIPVHSKFAGVVAVRFEKGPGTEWLEALGSLNACSIAHGGPPWSSILTAVLPAAVVSIATDAKRAKAIIEDPPPLLATKSLKDHSFQKSFQVEALITSSMDVGSSADQIKAPAVAAETQEASSHWTEDAIVREVTLKDSDMGENDGDVVFVGVSPSPDRSSVRRGNGGNQGSEETSAASPPWPLSPSVTLPASRKRSLSLRGSHGRPSRRRSSESTVDLGAAICPVEAASSATDSEEMSHATSAVKSPRASEATYTATLEATSGENSKAISEAVSGSSISGSIASGVVGHWSFG
jgi:hypothetical protein